ncbi:hypothetical protein Tco_1083963, partial [Tanacetum coccineum]
LLMLAKKLLTLRRASPVAEIKFKYARICLLFNLVACELIELYSLAIVADKLYTWTRTVSAIKARGVKEGDHIEKQFDDSCRY